MSVFRGDSGNGEVKRPGEASEANGTREAREANGTREASEIREASEANGTTTRTAGMPTASAMRRALARARDGKPLDVDEAALLLHARGEDLQTLLGYASRARDAGLEAAGRPDVITYSRKVFIPLTRLCQDRCGYCTFATVPHRLQSMYLEPGEVLAIARQGAELGCKEALFTLGDKPERRWHQAKDWLDAHGYDDTLSYVRAMAIRVLEETGLLPHLNPGVLSWQDFQRLKPVGPSMRIQAPPNLIGEAYGLILAAGIDDWGGVSPLTPDHVNPERPWPQIDELAARTAAGAMRQAGPTCMSPSTPPAGPRTAGTTSPRFTATGARSARGSSCPPGGRRKPPRRSACAPTCSRHCGRRSATRPGLPMRRHWHCSMPTARSLPR